jgi:hypothetical protein
MIRYFIEQWQRIYKDFANVFKNEKRKRARQSEKRRRLDAGSRYQDKWRQRG